jgi:hypothetical protein
MILSRLFKELKLITDSMNRTLFKMVVVATAALSSHSCKKESDPQVSISFTNNFKNGGNYWVVLSDQNGTVLSWKPLPDGSPTSLMFPQKDDSVNVTIIEQYGSGSSASATLTTYTNVVQGSYGNAPGNGPPVQTPNGTFKLINPDPANYVSFAVNADCGWTENTGATEYLVNVCEKSSLYVEIISQVTFVSRYLYIPQLAAGDSIVVDQTLFNSLPSMLSNNISLGEAAYGTTILTGTTSTQQNFLVSFWEPGYLQEPIPLFYPGQVGNLFTNYQAFVSYTRQSSPSVVYGFEKQTASPGNLTFQELQANLTSVNSKTTANLSYALSGSAHYVATNFNAQATSSAPFGSWTVYTQFSTNIQTNLPQFPDDLKKAVDLNFIANLSVNEITINQTSYGGYKSFYANTMLANSGPSSSTYKTYLPNSSGSFGARMMAMRVLARTGQYQIH